MRKPRSEFCRTFIGLSSDRAPARQAAPGRVPAGVAATIAATAQAAAAAAATGQPRFVERTEALPLAHVYAGGWEHFVGGGVAVLDCNGDGRLDLLAAGGSAPAHLFVNRTAGPGAPLRFDAGQLPELDETTGAYPLDIDGDGWTDLAVLRVGANRLLRGGPDCAFADATAEWGLATGAAWTTAFSATWEAGAALPTLAFGNYVDRDDPDGPFGACDDNQLVRPEPGGRRYGPPRTLAPGFCALSMLISDWRRDGRPELRISNDRHYYVRGGYEQMWQLDPLAERGEADGWDKVSLWGMGIASGDLTGDGLPEVLLTSMGDQLLQYNTGDGFRTAPYSAGATAHRPFVGDDGRPSTGWHAEFADVDNDGRLDLFIAKGNVDQMPSNAIDDPNNLLMQQPDGTFTEAAAAAGVASTARGRGAALADFDGDGRLDLVVVNRRAPLQIWQNVSADTGHWLEVEPGQDGPNRRAVGAFVELRAGGRTQVREITVGGGHAGGQAAPVHFGLGPARSAELRIIWPDGRASDWLAVDADRRLRLWRDGAALVER